ncbi:MAG: hypothetical protein K2L49_07115 [Muribaculaceae bacterium]|nr:hypothetical protein [Muribaculaceae bacterium]
MSAPYRILTAVIAIVMMWGCSSEDPSESVTLYDIVVFDGNVDGSACFSFRKNGDSPLIELVAPGRVLESESVNTGDRILIAYIPVSGEAYRSGDIDLKSVALINSDRLREGDVAGWDATPVYVQSIWRSGVYINLECKLDYADAKRSFYLVLDRSTAGNPVPELYIVHDMGELPPNFARRIYASWDISDVWDSPDCRGVKVYVNDSNRDIGSVTFMKP